MTQQISAELFTTNLYALLTETFESVQGIYLDGGTSLFETLADITAEEGYPSRYCPASIVKLTPNGGSFTPSFVTWLAPGVKFPSNLDGLDIAP